MSDMTIGELARRSGLPVRTLRFYADAGVLPEAARSEAGYRLFGPDAVARARLLRTLRELGVGLAGIQRVLAAEMSLPELAGRHVRALDAQIRALRLQRAVLAAVVQSTDAEELQRMTDLTSLTAGERRRIVDDYLEAVFGDEAGPVGDKIAMGAPELPDDPTPEQVTAWAEVAQLLRDPDFIAASRRMAQRASAEGAQPDAAQFGAGQAIGELAGPALRAGIDPASPAGRQVVERIEARTPGTPPDRAAAADRIEAFTDRRVGRYWTLVAIVNGWPASQAPDDVTDCWLWYAKALRAHASPAGDGTGSG